MDNKNNKILSFCKKHPIIVNFLAICVTFIVLCLITMLLLNIFTEHGKYKNVPNVKRLPVSEAIKQLESAGFRWEITDSTYNETFPLGSVIEQDPKPEAHAKSLRTVYLSVNASSPRTVSLPALNDMSLRQGESILQGLGFKNVNIVYETSPYKDLILSMTVNGRYVPAGTRLPLTAQITLTVGNGIEYEFADSLAGFGSDSILSSDF